MTLRVVEGSSSHSLNVRKPDPEGAVDELLRSIRLQKQGEEDFTREKRYPHCLFEDLGKQVVVVPSRLTYGFRSSVKAYFEMKSTEDVLLEASLFESGIYPRLESGTRISREVSIIDLGCGSGSKGALIAGSLIRQGHEVEYVCMDGSVEMLETSRRRMNQLGIPCQTRPLCFEAFPGEDLDRYRSSGGMIILLFLGRTYGNYDPVDIGHMLDNPALRATDLLLVGTGTLPGQNQGDFVWETLMEYWNPAMRIALLEAIGFTNRELRSHVVYNPDRRQFEMYVFVLEVSNPLLRELGITPGDIFLTGVARQPCREELLQELSQYFDTRLGYDDNLAPSYTVAFCRPRPRADRSDGRCGVVCV